MPTDAIAEAAGVTCGALYHQFVDKTALFEAVMLAHGIELGRIRPQPARPLAHALMGAGDEAALYVAEANDHAQARAEMIGVLDQLIAGVTA